MNPIIDRYASFDHCRALLPWFQFIRSPEPLPRLRKLILEMEAEAKGGRPPNVVMALFFHVPVSLRQIAIAFRRHGQTTRQKFGVRFRRQFADLFYLSWRLNHAPHDYYLQKMWPRPDRRAWAQYLQQREHVTFVKHLQRSLPIKQFDDKLEFFSRMKKAGIPTIDVVLAAAGGAWLSQFSMAQGDGMLQQDLVIKPTNSAMTEGVEIWRYERVTNTYTRVFMKLNGVEDWSPGEKSDLPGLLERVLRLSTKGTFIVQPRIKHISTLHFLSPRSLAHFRIVTAHCRGETKVIAALLRMGYENPSFIPSTYQANVDLDTGLLGVATGREAQWGFGESHLDTGERVTGKLIDHWPQLKAIAICGHEQYLWMPKIGWDVVDTDRGPVLMEANAFWGVDIAQVDAPFLGEKGYAEACLEAHARESGH